MPLSVKTKGADEFRLCQFAVISVVSVNLTANYATDDLNTFIFFISGFKLIVNIVLFVFFVKF